MGCHTLKKLPLVRTLGHAKGCKVAEVSQHHFTLHYFIQPHTMTGQLSLSKRLHCPQPMPTPPKLACAAHTTHQSASCRTAFEKLISVVSITLFSSLSPPGSRIIQIVTFTDFLNANLSAHTSPDSAKVNWIPHSPLVCLPPTRCHHDMMLSPTTVILARVWSKS